MAWIAAAFGSAFFAGIVSILAKIGMSKTDPDVATALRTCVVLVFAWAIVGMSGSFSQIGAIDANSWVFLILSGASTGASWICYFRALSCGDVNKVVPIDKSSAALASLAAIALFSETTHLFLRLFLIAAILAGTYLMIEKRTVMPSGKSGEADRNKAWIGYAVLAAVFAALTSLFGKMGMEGIDSNLGTAIRTCVVLAMTFGIVIARGKLPSIASVDRREALFLLLSGIATGASWMLFYFALQTGVVSTVVQIDKLSILISIAFAYFAFGERLSRRSGIGLAIIVIGTIALTAISR